MQNEDYSLQLTVLKSGNAHLKSLCKRLQKSLAEVSKLQDLFEINEEKIQNYSLILRNLSNYIQKIETKTAADKMYFVYKQQGKGTLHS